MSRAERSEVVLDASAVLAMLQAEAGGESVEQHLSRSAISSVNWSEVVQKASEHGVATQNLRTDLEALGLDVVPFSAAQAERAASLREPTRPLGLSLADRACLALALERSSPAFTTDRAWSALALEIEIRVLR
jgi:ribonuclease VapC